MCQARLISEIGLGSKMASAADLAPSTCIHRAAHGFEPLNDPRWDIFLTRHSSASVFHSSPWLKALNQTYGYPVVGYTTSAPGEDLENALVFCRVESWLTGRRLVSLPFSDHCEPLVDRNEDLQILVNAVEEETRREKWRYVEIRPLTPLTVTTSLHVATTQYSFHELDLRFDLETIFRNLHKDSIQRKIRRAEREKLCYEEGTSDSLLNDFYQMLELTRRRHRLPPQPKKWFQNLVSCFGDSLKIRIARRDGRALAAMLTIRNENTLIYKYGGSDTRYNKLGGMHLLYWTSIQEAKTAGLQFFDLGRTDPDQSGLITFKSRWGAKESSLTYSRYTLSGELSHTFNSFGANARSVVARDLLAYLPNSLVSLLGRALYKHIG